MRHDIYQKSERDLIPDYQKRAIRFAAAKRQPINQRRGQTGQYVEISAFKRHQLRNLSGLEKPEQNHLDRNANDVKNS